MQFHTNYVHAKFNKKNLVKCHLVKNKIIFLLFLRLRMIYNQDRDVMNTNNGKHTFCNKIHLFSIVIIETCCTNPPPKLIVSFLSLTNCMHTAIYAFTERIHFENAT